MTLYATPAVITAELLDAQVTDRDATSTPAAEVAAGRVRPEVWSKPIVQLAVAPRLLRKPVMSALPAPRAGERAASIRTFRVLAIAVGLTLPVWGMVVVAVVRGNGGF